MKLKLFQQNPKEEKFQVDASLRQMQSLDIDRKEDLEKFRAFLEKTAKEKSDLPDQKELDELNKTATKGKGISLGMLGVIAAIPLAGLALGGGLTGLSKIASDSLSAITGGGQKPGAGATNKDNLLGLDTKDKPGGAGPKGKFPRMPALPGRKLFGGKSSTPVAPKTSAAPSRPASAAPRSNVAGNQVRGQGQLSRLNANRSQAAGSTTTPKRPSRLKAFGSKLETGTAFGGKGSKLQKRFHKLFKGKNPLSGFIKKIFGSQAGRKAIGKVIGKAVRKIPLVGALIGFLMDITLGGESAARAGFKAAGTALGGLVFSGIGAAAGSMVPFVGNAIGYALGLWGGMEFGNWFGGWLHDRIFGGSTPPIPPAADKTTTEHEILFGKEEQQKEAPPAPELPAPGQEPAAQPLRSSQTTQNMVPTGTGGVNQWLHGTPGRPGYDAGHAGMTNAHDHFSFTSRAAAVKAYKALKAAGYKPYEFEGYDYVGKHSPTGGHFGPVGAPPTYNDTSDGTAFDIPWSSYGSGPIGQSDYDKSLRAAQIVGAVDSTGTDFSGEAISGDGAAPTGTPNYGTGRTQQQQQGPNLIERVTKMLGPYATEVMEAFKVFGYMADKDLMQNTQLYGRDPQTGLPLMSGARKIEPPEPEQEEVAPPQMEYGIEEILKMVAPKEMEVSRLTPEAEASLNDIFVINNQQMVGGGGGAGAEQPADISLAANPTPTPGVLVLGGGGSSMRDTYRRMYATKIG